MSSPFEKLTAVEKKVIILMRALQPYQKIEIKLKDNERDEISVIHNATIREDFPVDLL